MDATTVAVDLAKDVFEVAVANRGGRIVDRKRLSRAQFERFISDLTPGTLVVMEACGTAHYWGRQCQLRDADVRLLPAQYVRPYVRRNKTDRTDAEALLEAQRCGSIHAVPVKTVEQQTLQVLHRVRAQWQKARTARINAMRGILRELGVSMRVGASTALSRIPAIVADAAIAVPAVVRDTVSTLLEEVGELEARIATVDQQLARVTREDPVGRRLMTIPGVGVISATALLGAVGHIHGFRRGRHFACWLGLTPREHSSGHRRRLGGISKQGDAYLRCLLTHGARAVLVTAQRKARLTPHTLTRLQRWAVACAATRGHNKATVAVANKLARIIWAVWSRDADFDARRGESVAA